MRGAAARERPDPAALRIEELAAELRAELVERHRAAATDPDDRRSLEQRLSSLVRERAALLGPASRQRLLERILRDTVGLGPLEDLLADPGVDEILVNGHREVWVERSGVLERAGAGFASETHLREVIERILGPIGRRVDELNPMADGRLADGSRVNVVIPPLAVDGPTVAIRRFGGLRPGPGELVRLGTIPEPLMESLAEAVAAGRSILISGGTGSGKTTVLNALSSFVPQGERTITIEDSAELRLEQPHVVRLETRPPSVEGEGAVSIRDLVRNALRMRPDRLIIGEVRGPEALDLLAALNTGHGGALTTVHANGAVDVLRRLETLAMMAAQLPHAAIREQLAGAIDLVLHLERGRDGRRRAEELVEVGEAARSLGVSELWRRETFGRGEG